jgi:hypothetical protein
MKESAPKGAPTVPGQRNCQDDTPPPPAREHPDREYRRRLTDDEVRALGYTHRDDRGYWQKPSPPTPDRTERHRVIGTRRCLTCGVADDRHFEWCWRGDELEHTVGAELRNARDLQAAIAWQPPERDLELNPVLTPPEREQLGRLFDALVRAREQARGEVPCARKLWSIPEWRNHVARREGAA